MSEIEGRFDGNICRCTGYRSIMTACHSFAADAPDSGETIAGREPVKFETYDPSTEPACVAAAPSAVTIRAGGKLWHRALTVADVQGVLSGAPGKNVQLVCGGTSAGVYPAQATDCPTDVFCDISAVAELCGVAMTGAGLQAGAAVTLSQLLAALEANAGASASYGALATHIKKVANWQVRNVGSWAGNLVMARTRGFASDVATLLMGAGARLKLLAARGECRDVDVHTFLHEADTMDTAAGVALVVLSVTIPPLAEGELLCTYRTSMRPNNAHAFVNACFRATVRDGVVSGAVLAFGVVQHKAVFAVKAQDALNGAALDVGGLAGVLEGLEALEVQPEEQYHAVNQPEGKDAYRRNVCSSFVYKFFVAVIEKAGAPLPDSVRSAGGVLIDAKGTSTGTQTFETSLPEGHPGLVPRPKVEATEQAAGQTVFHDDIQLGGQVYAVLVPTTRAPASIDAIDAAAALAMPGVLEWVGWADAPGAAGSFAAIKDGGEALFVNVGDENVFVGQPVGCIVARSRREAEAAAKAVRITYGEPASPGLYSIEQAEAAGSYMPMKGDTCAHGGDVDEAFAAAAAAGGTVVEGTFQIGGPSRILSFVVFF